MPPLSSAQLQPKAGAFPALQTLRDYQATRVASPLFRPESGFERGIKLLAEAAVAIRIGDANGYYRSSRKAGGFWSERELISIGGPGKNPLGGWSN